LGLLSHEFARHQPWGGRIRLWKKRFLIHAAKSPYPAGYKKPFSEVSSYKIAEQAEIFDIILA
jgi:hypothetical protein